MTYSDMDTMTRARSPWGHGKNPNSLAAIAKKRFKPGLTSHQLCTAMKRDGTPCRMVALSGLKVCGVHGGFSVKARQGLYKPKRNRHAFQCDAPRLGTPDRRALMALTLWQQPLSQRTRDRLVMAYDRRQESPEQWRLALNQAQAEAAERHDRG